MFKFADFIHSYESPHSSFLQQRRHPPFGRSKAGGYSNGYLLLGLSKKRVFVCQPGCWFFLLLLLLLQFVFLFLFFFKCADSRNGLGRRDMCVCSLTVSSIYCNIAPRCIGSSLLYHSAIICNDLYSQAFVIVDGIF
jgi:hypothetical protein